MILSFANKETEKLFRHEFTKRIPPDIASRALVKLEVLEFATSPYDLYLPPSNHLEKLGGDLNGFWSIRINNQWRILFDFDEREKGFKNVKLVDYH